jgi:hypothetical protein
LRNADCGKLLRPLVNFTSMSDVVQIDAALLNVEFVKDAVIANSQLEFRSAFESLVSEASQSCTHLVHLALHRITDRYRKGIKCFGERRRPNLERGGHDLFWLSRRVLSGRDLAPRLI